MWRGLGYYRRARSLLAGAKTVMGNKKYKGRLPDSPSQMEKEIDGVGRYTAGECCPDEPKSGANETGAICSMAYGVRTPIVRVPVCSQSSMVWLTYTDRRQHPSPVHSPTRHTCQPSRPADHQGIMGVSRRADRDSTGRLGATGDSR
jgi:hypothetical protein